MACVLMSPDGSRRGCVVFTTQERDNVIKTAPGVRAQIEGLKSRYLVGLHHNWHDHQFTYDPLFDFSMSGEGDLIEISGRDFPLVPLDACNFSPRCYSLERPTDPLWDILYVARAVAFKGIPEFFAAIRSLYDNGLQPRVLFVCPTPERIELPGIPDLRKYFESMFNMVERERVTLLTIEWDYPFPFDAEALSLFYRNSKIFFHPAPDERRCRTAAYAWAGRMSVVANQNVASILPERYRRTPFLFSTENSGGAVSALTLALSNWSRPDSEWADVAAQFSAKPSADRMVELLREVARKSGQGLLSESPINESKLDFRLGRHHGISFGGNRVDFSVSKLCEALMNLPDGEIARLLLAEDPELALRDFCSEGDQTAAKAPLSLPPWLTRMAKRMRGQRGG